MSRRNRDLWSTFATDTTRGRGRLLDELLNMLGHFSVRRYRWDLLMLLRGQLGVQYSSL